MVKPNPSVHTFSAHLMLIIQAKSISSNGNTILAVRFFEFAFFREFLMASTSDGDVTKLLAKGNPEKKLKWAFKMYDIDSNGSVDRQEMLKIIEVSDDCLRLVLLIR